MRAHKAFRQLATLLSRKGFDVYRFDYLGTGDSYLDAKHADFNDYVDSGSQVLQYITQNHTYESIDLVGLRLGSLVAANIPKENIAVRKLVLWDPYENGRSFLEDCAKNASGVTLKDTSWTVHGFELPTPFRKSIDSKVIPDSNSATSYTTYLALSYENNDTRKLQKSVQNNAQTILVGPKNDWNYVDMVGSLLMPTELIKQIVNIVADS